MSGVYDGPGDGWIRVEAGMATIGQPIVAFYPVHDGGAEYWIPKRLIEPLPTEALALIRATWKARGGGGPVETYVLAGDGKWTNVNSGVRHTPKELLDGIESWEPVS